MGEVAIMKKRSIVNIDHNGLSTEGKYGVCLSHRFDEDEIAFSPNINFIDTFKPLLGDQYSLFTDFCAHIDLQNKCNVIIDYCIAIQKGRAQRKPIGWWECDDGFRLSPLPILRLHISPPLPRWEEGWGEMNINLHIERLVLDGIPLGPGQRPLLQSAMQTELTRLLANGGLNEALQTGSAFYSVRAAGIRLTGDAGPARMGQQIAKAAYGGIGK